VHLKSILPATACTSIIISAEIRFGLGNDASQKLQFQATQKQVSGNISTLNFYQKTKKSRTTKFDSVN
jgi:hypothetical protein